MLLESTKIGKYFISQIMEKGYFTCIDASGMNGIQSLWLIENHIMADADIPILEKRMPEIVATSVDHLIYYYYPRNLSQPNKNMNIIKTNISRF